MLYIHQHVQHMHALPAFLSKVCSFSHYGTPTMSKYILFHCPKWHVCLLRDLHDPYFCSAAGACPAACDEMQRRRGYNWAEVLTRHGGTRQLCMETKSNMTWNFCIHLNINCWWFCLVINVWHSARSLPVVPMHTLWNDSGFNSDFEGTAIAGYLHEDMK